MYASVIIFCIFQITRQIGLGGDLIVGGGKEWGVLLFLWSHLVTLYEIKQILLFDLNTHFSECNQSFHKDLFFYMDLCSI